MLSGKRRFCFVAAIAAVGLASTSLAAERGRASGALPRNGFLGGGAHGFATPRSALTPPRSGVSHTVPGRTIAGPPNPSARGAAALARRPVQAIPGAFARRAADPLRAGNPSGSLARNGLLRRPFPGEAGFTGVPPRGETRFVTNELIVHVGENTAPQVLDAAARRLGLTLIGTQRLAFLSGTLAHFRIAQGAAVADVVGALEAEKIGVAQPNYVYRLQQNLPAVPASPTPAAVAKADASSYVVAKLKLSEVHSIANGDNVPVAVIDSKIDAAHPDLAGSIAGEFDATAAPDKADEHGTGMTSAIVAHRRVVGVAPHALILAAHAFSPSIQSQQATSRSIVAGIDWAISRGARVINMSFAGPYDPVLAVALKKAHDKGVVLVAAAGNLGPQSPPLYPAADENVIAVTAVDANDKLLAQANRGPHIALAAPGVDVLEAAPQAGYAYSTGTSIAAAHVSGVAALLIERDPMIDVATLENILFSTAKDLGPPGRDPQFGFGLVDPYRALNALEAKVVLRHPAGRDFPPAPGAALPAPAAGGGNASLRFR